MIDGAGRPTPDHRRIAMHDGKKVYLSSGKAMLASLVMQDKYSQRYTIYDCVHGDAGKHWHVGTPVGEGINRHLNDWEDIPDKETKWL